MAAAILTEGKTEIRNALKTLVTHIGLSTDTTAFNVAQTELDPANVGASNNLIKASAEADVDAFTFDATITVDGTTELTGKAVATISLMYGATRTSPISRTVRSQTIGIQAGDSFTIGIRVTVEDNS